MNYDMIEQMYLYVFRLFTGLTEHRISTKCPARTWLILILIVFTPCNCTSPTVPTVSERQGSPFFGVNGAAKVMGAMGAGAKRCNNVGARAVSLNFLADGIPRMH